MAKSKVFFTPAGATNWCESMICKAKEMFYVAELDKCIKPGDSVAIKLHCGEYNRTASLRPEYVAAIVEEVKGAEASPCNRHHNPDLSPLQFPFDEINIRKCAYRHGFNLNSWAAPSSLLTDSSAMTIRVDIPNGNILRKPISVGRRS